MILLTKKKSNVKFYITLILTFSRTNFCRTAWAIWSFSLSFLTFRCPLWALVRFSRNDIYCVEISRDFIWWYKYLSNVILLFGRSPLYPYYRIVILLCHVTQWDFPSGYKLAFLKHFSFYLTPILSDLIAPNIRFLF